MPHYCYRCGRPVFDMKPHKRRRVRTGEVERRWRPAARPHRFETRYGYRIVCGRCARILDNEFYRRSLGEALSILAALLALTILALILRA